MALIYYNRIILNYYVVVCILIALNAVANAFLYPQSLFNYNNKIKPVTTQLQSTSSNGVSNHHYGADERRQQSLEQGNNPLFSLNLNLDALARSGAAPRAQELLKRIHALYQEGYYEVSPDTVSYNSVLKAWKEDDDPEKAFDLLVEMLRYDPNDDSNNIQPNVISFNTVILAFARRGNYRQAITMLRQMEEEESLPQPDIVTYNSVLYSFAQSSDDGAAIQAENLLREMMHPKSNVAADTTSFNTVIFAWSNLAQKKTISRAHRAQDLLEHMESIAAAGNINIVPDEYSYTTVIQAWAKCEKPLRAQQVLDSMTSQNLTPNRITYTAVMSSLAKSGQAGRAQQILDDMMYEYSKGNVDMKPDTVAFSCVMDGYARISGVDKPYVAKKAMRLLERMQRLEHKGMGPNYRTYTSVLTALAKSGVWEACEQARRLVQKMEIEYEQGNDNLKPSNIHYNAVLNAYARSPRADKALKASRLFHEMQRHPDPRCRPDIISYNSLLMACANAFGNTELKQNSFRIALEAFKTVMANEEEGIKPTSTTFAHFCKASRRLLSPSQQKSVLQKTFKLCCQKGLVNHVVLQHLQMACKSEDEWNDMVGEASNFLKRNDKIQVSRFPNSWVCHARR